MPTNVTRRVTLGLFGDITDLKSKLSWISTEKQKLERDGVTVPIDADAKKATLTVDDLRKKLADLSAKRASVLVNVDDKKAVASILNIDAKLASLDKKTSTPKISVTGAARALADIAAIDAAFDEMNRKAANAGGSRGGGFLGLFGGGGSSGGSGAASALSGLPFGLGNPAVLGGVAAASPFAGQALGGAAIFGLGSILAGLGIAGAFGLGGSSTPAQVAAAQQALRAAQLREQVAQAANVKKLVGLGQRLHHRPNQLSGGEQQRVAIARALVADPAVVIMDEPTGNLDGQNGAKVLELIRDLRAQTGTTFLIATHDPRVASAAERTLSLMDGLLISDGASDASAPTAQPEVHS